MKNVHFVMSRVEVWPCYGSLLGPNKHDRKRLKGFRRWWYSMFGRNKRDGTTENPVAPKHFSGGAACGSGVAVASNAVDFALGMGSFPMSKR
jgi:hypothetical protein